MTTLRLPQIIHRISLNLLSPVDFLPPVPLSSLNLAINAGDVSSLFLSRLRRAPLPSCLFRPWFSLFPRLLRCCPLTPLRQLPSLSLSITPPLILFAYPDGETYPTHLALSVPPSVAIGVTRPHPYPLPVNSG
jgi:hypothetical protein